MKRYLRIFEIYPGGWLMLSILYFFADLDEFLLIISAVLVHEIGHLFVMERLGVRVRRITLGYTGMTIRYNEAMLYGIREFVAAISGPMLGLAAAVIFSCLGNVFQSECLLLFSGCNVIMSAFNLLPAKPLDGWRCLHAFFPKSAQMISVCTALVILAVGLWVMYLGYGTALAIMGIILLLQETPQRTKRRFA